MRRFLTGWVLALGLLLLLAPGRAAAQTKGEVESIGFNNYYRPSCWTPMVVRIRPEKSGTFQLQVVQEDLDKDRPVFTRTIALTGKDEGGGEQRFWMYFIPQPTNKGLMDVSQGGTLRDLQGQIKVFLCTDAPPGQLGKQLIQLPITSTITSLEPPTQNVFAAPRGNKLVLAVSDGRTGSQPAWREYETAVGLSEDVTMVLLRPNELPESVLAYEAVDAIVWLNADPPDPSKPTEERRMRALEQFVRSGRQLVICQTPERDRTRAWRAMLPVTVQDVVEKADPEPLRTIALAGETILTAPPQPNAPPVQRAPPAPPGGGGDAGQGAQFTPLVDRRAQWENLAGPFRMARATPKPGAVVAEWIEWDDAGKDRTPYLVRQPFGAGCVTWVAHDLGDPSLTRARIGWPRVWDRVFDWKNQTVLVHNYTTSDQRNPWERGPVVDVGKSFDNGMNLEAKSRAFVGLAVVFFVVYWLAAGPGLYLYLAAKARAQLSWFLFAFAGVAATVVTVLVVQLLVRGEPELQHVTVVRQAPDQPTIAHARFGLYIPRDGAQDIALRDVAPGSASYVTAYAVHPQHLEDVKFPANLEYAVPVREAGDADETDDDAAPVRIAVPYRSTLKKLEAHWIGNMTGGVSGSATLMTGPIRLNGFVTNGSGGKLRNVYFCFRDANRNDAIIFRPTWDPAVSIDLGKELLPANVKFVTTPADITPTSTVPERGEPLRDYIRVTDIGWTRYWFEPLRNTGFNQTSAYSDWGNTVMRSFPMLSLFDRLPPMQNVRGQPQNRVELLRRSARWMDVSPAITAGQLVVLAESETDTAPLPIPLEVEGDRVAGRGKVFYQFVLPLDRSALPVEGEANDDATTTPVTTPATPADEPLERG